ncbi:MAG: hypothetical protein R3E48_10525 [Burkholderiaceae bacterium]
MFEPISRSGSRPSLEIGISEAATDATTWLGATLSELDLVSEVNPVPAVSRHWNQLPVRRTSSSTAEFACAMT